MATLNEIKHITSSSQNSMSMVVLEFEQGVNMDSTGVDIQQKIAALQGSWDDSVGTPYVLKINTDMLPVEIDAVSREGMDVAELSEFVEKTLAGKLEGITGVASVSVGGVLQRQMNVILSQEKLDALSAKLAAAVNGQLDAAQAQLDAGKAQLNSQKADVTTQLRDAITELDKQIPELEKKIASLQTDLDEANRKLEDAKNTSTTLPEVTLPIDDALFASCKTVLAAYDAQYNADALPANLAEAKSDLNKMGAMINSIVRADAAIRQRAADEGLLEQNMTVEQTAAYLDAQYAAMSARIQALEVEIASLQDTLNNTEDESERADLQAQIDAKRAEQAQDQAVIDGNAARRARVSELSGNLSTLSTTKVALQNATTLLTARQEAETALNDGMQPLQQTLNDTAAALRDRLSAAGIRVSMDDSDQSAGWKFAQYEMKGVPLRVEIGPKDMEKGQCCIARRDTGEKTFVPLTELESSVKQLLQDVHDNLYAMAEKNLENNTFDMTSWEEVREMAQGKGGFARTKWCGSLECELAMKEKAGVSSRCMPLKQSGTEGKCVMCGKPATTDIYWGVAY